MSRVRYAGRSDVAYIQLFLWNTMTQMAVMTIDAITSSGKPNLYCSMPLIRFTP